MGSELMIAPANKPRGRDDDGGRGGFRGRGSRGGFGMRHFIFVNINSSAMASVKLLFGHRVIVFLSKCRSSLATNWHLPRQ